MHVKAKGNDGTHQMDVILQAIRSDNNPVVGYLAREAHEGDLIRTWTEKPKNSNLRLIDTTNGLSDLLTEKGVSYRFNEDDKEEQKHKEHLRNACISKHMHMNKMNSGDPGVLPQRSAPTALGGRPTEHEDNAGRNMENGGQLASNTYAYAHTSLGDRGTSVERTVVPKENAVMNLESGEQLSAHSLEFCSHVNPFDFDPRNTEVHAVIRRLERGSSTSGTVRVLSTGIGDDPGVLEPSKELIAYKNVNDLPAPWRKFGIRIDSKNKAILLPFYGSMDVSFYSICSKDIVALIEELQQVFDTAERKALITQEKLVLARDKSRTIKLSNLCFYPWLARWGREIPGTLEAHVNGFQYYASKPDQQVDIMFGNIKHAVFQPADNEMKILLHFHLHKRIMVGNRIANNVQFYHEVMEVGETLGGWRRSANDPVEIKGEHGERERKNKINEEFEIFVNLRFYGVHDGATEFIVLAAACLIKLMRPCLVITLSEIAMVSVERVGYGQKDFDVLIVSKDLKGNVFQMKSIPTTSLERIKVWLDSIDIKHYESRINLHWRPILKAIMVEPHLFIEDGEWDFLNMDKSDSDSEKSDKDYEPSDVEAESEPDDGDSNSESLAFKSSVESKDDEEDFEEDLEEEEMTWSEWEEATNADREVGNKSNSEGKRWRMELKALGKSRGGTSSTSSPKRVKLA
ncbi:hypothetical protein Ancab_028067 [Ancistrocladus abbreviatus]